MSLNKVIILGRLGKDPEIKTLPSGSTVSNFSLAVSESWKDKDGQKQERTEWVSGVVFGKQAENLTKYCRKGDQIMMIGRLQTREWEGKDGQKRSATEVIANTVQWFLPSKKQESKQTDFGAEPNFDNNEEIPF